MQLYCKGQARVLHPQRAIASSSSGIRKSCNGIARTTVLHPQRKVLLHRAAVLQYHNLIYAIKGKIFKSD
ncbi:MAG: hypothetical protein IPL95_12945 [Saprospiraceae bacterium]|nr:hypothetical protein [Saprospiraceae bacterium]